MAQTLNSLPVGAKVKFGKYSVNGEAAESIIWLVVAKNHSSSPAYPSNSVTLLTESVIDLRCIDAKEPNSNNATRVTKGNNNYGLSNIDQWLNKDSAGGEWYNLAHNTDQAPGDASVLTGGTTYAERPGFLNAFTLGEKNAILNTTIRVARPDADRTGADTSAYEDISRKVFFASAAEVGISTDVIAEGAKWSYFTNNKLVAKLTSQAYINSLSTNLPSPMPSSWGWWLRTPLPRYANQTYYITKTGENTIGDACMGNVGIRPALNLLSSIEISDTTDNDGCYIIKPNLAPDAPSVINVPTVYGGKSHSISWRSVTDPDGDAVTYQLECSINGDPYTQIYSGASTSYAHIVPYGTGFITYRVKATDILGDASAYKTSATITVINNNAPEISVLTEPTGDPGTGYTCTYRVEDAEGNAVSVTESIDGVPIRSFVATLGKENTCSIRETTWLALSNGTHTLRISATDGIDTSVKTYLFIKSVGVLRIQNATPWDSSTMPGRIMLVITRNVPSAATFKVEVSNNGYDTSPTWEDATDAVMSGLVHVFSNKSKTATNWGVLVRVTVERNGSTGACYISAIGGNFE